MTANSFPISAQVIEKSPELIPCLRDSIIALHQENLRQGTHTQKISLTIIFETYVQTAKAISYSHEEKNVFSLRIKNHLNAEGLDFLLGNLITDCNALFLKMNEDASSVHHIDLKCRVVVLSVNTSVEPQEEWCDTLQWNAWTNYKGLELNKLIGEIPKAIQV